MRRTLLTAVIAITVTGLTALPGADRPARAQNARPNVLIIMTDDQRTDTMGVMPQTMEYFDTGVSFPNAIATTPLCCPSRASIFTGQFVHNHGVRSNGRREAKDFDHSRTLQRYLQGAGYRTGIFGKFFNGWDIVKRPPYFDEFAIIKRGYHNARFGFGLNGQHVVRYVPEYSTTVIKKEALRFIERAEYADDRPWLMYITPFAPHDPATPPGRYEEAPVPPFEPDPSMVEEDLTDKPPQYSSYMSPFDESQVALKRAKQMRSLMAVDDLVASVTRALDAAEEDNTLVFFMSDNGYLWSEHGLSRKGLPYLPSVRIPLMMRWDAYSFDRIDDRLAANIDIAPTVFDAAGIFPEHDMDGRSLLMEWDRDEILAEVFADRSRPDLWWASLISHDHQYIEYYGWDETVPIFREYYDLTTDPWQLNNLLADGDPTNDPDVPSLSTRLAKRRLCPQLEPCP